MAFQPFPPADKHPQPHNPYRGVLVVVCVAAVLALGLSVLLARRFRETTFPLQGSPDSPSASDPEIAALLEQLDRDLHVPTTAGPPPLERVRRHDAEFARRRSAEVMAQKTTLENRKFPAEVEAALKQAVREELAALTGEQRALNRLSRYDDELGRKERHDNYRKRRLEVFLARRKRIALEQRESSSTSRAAASRERARALRLLKELDRRYAETGAAVLGAHLDVLEDLHSRTDYHDPLYLLYNDEMRALRRERVCLHRTTLYQRVADRTKPRQRLAAARLESLRLELTTTAECQRRLPPDSSLFWDYDQLVALLQEHAGRPTVVLACGTPEAALAELAASLRRERRLIDARRHVAAAMAEQGRPREAAPLFTRWADALQRQLDTMDSLVRRAEGAAASRPPPAPPGFQSEAPDATSPRRRTESSE